MIPHISPQDRFNHHAASREDFSSVLSEAIGSFGLDPNRAVPTALSGGFMNANFRVEEAGKRFLFRIYSRDWATAERERDLLRILKGSQVRVPQALDLFESEGRPVGVLEYVDGMTLEDRLADPGAIAPSFYEELGGQLAHVHEFQFQDAGFIGPGVKPGKEYENFSVFLRQFIDRTLLGLESRPEFHGRLGLEINQRVRRLVADRWDMVLETETTHRLVHCDFNPKNLLVSRTGDPKLLAIIDWEFCVSGNGLIDLGNFFRFSYDYPDEARAHFEAGYRSVFPDLPGNWSEVASLLDVGNMCSFLGGSEDYPKSFRTARTVLASTLEKFGY